MEDDMHIYTFLPLAPLGLRGIQTTLFVCVCVSVCVSVCQQVVWFFSTSVMGEI